MTPARPPRLADRIAQLAILAACVAVVLAGSRLLAFETLLRRANDLPAGADPVPAAGLYRAVAAWGDTVGVAGQARRAQVALLGAGDDVAEALARSDISMPASSPDVPRDAASLYERDVARLLAVTPADAQVWSVLAELRWAREAREDALTAWRLSRLTGPREGAGLDRRAAFGLERWAALPEADQAAALRDLAAVLASSLDAPLSRDVLARQDEATRLALRDALIELGTVQAAHLAKARLPRPDPASGAGGGAS